MYLFFDTETTGVPKNWKAPLEDFDNWPRLVQLAYILYDNDGKEVLKKEVIVKPEGFEIPIGASNIHGVTTERANKEGKDLLEVLKDFYEVAKQANVLVCHNYAFDSKVMGVELLRNGLVNIVAERGSICTMLKSVDVCKIKGNFGKFKWPKLDELHIHLFGEDFKGAHNAMADIQATAKCFWEMKKRGNIA